MIDLSVKVDATAALQALDRIEDPALKQRIAEKVADEVVLPALQKYPTPSGRKQQWVSEKQRRFVIAAIRNGQIRVPYNRTGRTGSSYTKQAISDGIAVTSALPSAEYTRGPGQAAYHRGTWPTHEDIVVAVEGDAALAATTAVVEAIGDAGP